MTNKHIESNYKKWLNFSKIITSSKEYEDLLHDLIIKLQEVPDTKATDNYIFISLRNMFLTRLSKNKINYDIDIDNYQNNLLDETEILNLINEDKIKQDKLDSIACVVSKLSHFEKRLYQLHIIFGLSQRRIAKEIGVSHITINQRINKIKEKIRLDYES